MKIILIRHGKTQGNIEKRFIGITDEPLCDAGRLELKAKAYPKADFIISSPLKRCVETAEIIYGRCDETEENLKECDFGILEGKNHEELMSNTEYVQWLNMEENREKSEIEFPKGESRKALIKRCSECLLKITEKHKDKNRIAVITHGGVIMAVMDRLSEAKGDFYDWSLKNGCFIEVEVTEDSKLKQV